MKLETERLLLRPWKAEDAESLYKYASDDRVGPIAGWNPHKSVEESTRIIYEVLSAEGTFAVVLKETNEPIGSIGLITGEKSNLRLPENEAEIGYWIGVPYWGQGLMTECLKTLSFLSFEHFGLKTLSIVAHLDNKASQRVAQKSGFVLKRQFKGSDRYTRKVRDYVVYQLKRGDYRYE